MRYLWVVVAVASFISGCEPAEVTRGREHYDRLCALCHGDFGEGYVSAKANALSNPDFLASVSDAFLTTAIEQGRPGTKMGAYGEAWLGPLDETGVADLIAYLRTYQVETVTLDADWNAVDAGGDLANGLELYRVQCSYCHGDTAQGDAALSLNNRTFLETATDDYLRYAIALGRRGTVMGQYDASLTAQEITDLVVAIRSFGAQSGE